MGELKWAAGLGAVAIGAVRDVSDSYQAGFIDGRGSTRRVNIQTSTTNAH